MAGLTVQQEELLRFIRGYQARKGVSPSYDEMRDHLGLASKSGIHRLITALHQRGYIRRRYNEARAIIVMDDLCVQLEDRTTLKLFALAEAEGVSAEVLAGQIIARALGVSA